MRTLAELQDAHSDRLDGRYFEAIERAEYQLIYNGRAGTWSKDVAEHFKALGCKVSKALFQNYWEIKL